jgi:hypothetical protein
MPCRNPTKAKEDDIDYSKIQFSPAIPMPIPFDVKKRIEQLRTYLDPNHPDYQREYQHVNIKATIKLYEEGKIDGTQEVYIRDGKIVSREEALKGPLPFGTEGGIHYQMAQKHSYGHGPFGANFHEVGNSFPLNFSF